MSDFVRDQLAARRKIDEIADRRRPDPYPHLEERRRAIAAELLSEWWIEALAHGITTEDLAYVSDLAAIAYDAVGVMERRS